MGYNNLAFFEIFFCEIKFRFEMGPKTKVQMIEWGTSFGKRDSERVGLFAEMPYMNGRGYVSPFARPKAEKGLKSFTCPGTKTVCGTQHGLFESQFKRIFAGEAMDKTPKPMGGFKDAKRLSERPFVSGSGNKKHATPGDHFGTFGGIIPEFSPLKKTTKKLPPPERNFYTNPVKKGGPGYINITLGKYPEYMWSKYGTKLVVKQYGKILDGPMITMIHPKPFFEKNPYAEVPGKGTGRIYVRPKERPFTVIGNGIIVPVGPGKKLGGCKAGGFDKFPVYMPDRYKPAQDALKHPREPKVFNPITRSNKSYYFRSILNRNVDFRITADNYSKFEPTYVKYLV